MRIPALLALLALSLALPACTEGEPPGRDQGRPDARVAYLRHWVPLRRASDRSLFFLARFETREEDVMALFPDAGLDIREPDLPVKDVTAVQALRIARAYWGRLPTFEEWHTAVAGPNRYRFPWGEDEGSRLRANTLRLGLGHRTRVGTFESGRDLGSRYSCYDLFGNVAEWTLTPWAYVAMDALLAADRKRTDVQRLYDVFWLAHYCVPDSLLPLLTVPAVVDPLSPASPFLPELCSSLQRPSLLATTEFCVVGFSHDQAIPGRHIDTTTWQQNGVRPMLPRETASDVGMRMATDPYTLLSVLERAEGEPRAADFEVLAGFLLRYRDEFLRAARLRRRLDRGFLGLPPPGRWAEKAYRLLGA